jgi:hypothetical protein
VKVEDGLPRPGPDVHHDPIVLETGDLRRLGDELEHRSGLVRREGADVAKGVNVALREHEEMSVSLRVDVADGDESVTCMDVVAVADEGAEETV